MNSQRGLFCSKKQIRIFSLFRTISAFCTTKSKEGVGRAQRSQPHDWCLCTITCRDPRTADWRWKSGWSSSSWRHSVPWKQEHFTWWQNSRASVLLISTYNNPLLFLNVPNPSPKPESQSYSSPNIELSSHLCLRIIINSRNCVYEKLSTVLDWGVIRNNLP